MPLSASLACHCAVTHTHSLFFSIHTGPPCHLLGRITGYSPACRVVWLTHGFRRWPHKGHDHPLCLCSSHTPSIGPSLLTHAGPTVVAATCSHLPLCRCRGRYGCLWLCGFIFFTFLVVTLVAGCHAVKVSCLDASGGVLRATMRIWHPSTRSASSLPLVSSKT
jgi:hypothetical protein